jgi:hypothetical protein
MPLCGLLVVGIVLEFAAAFGALGESGAVPTAAEGSDE